MPVGRRARDLPGADVSTAAGRDRRGHPAARRRRRDVLVLQPALPRRLRDDLGDVRRPMTAAFDDVEDVQRRLDAVDYLVDEGLATALHLAVTLGQPLLLEGEPGVGKTAAAKALAAALDTPL